ncbi:response regulator transcription factor [Ghiorsea bivora]|uniref:response regulator transcription factor n=1 Tax=Ghiorsea bivora TaxID=1485545 RepID=UPI00068D951F|nr:response regulator transcription factor [Ghiorsea bivora]
MHEIMDDMITPHPTLLLVDDDELYCRILGNALSKRGFSVLTAHNVQQALEVVGEVPPKYAVIDLNMPGDSGLVLIEKIHKLDPESHIVVLTGYASVATAVEAIKLGATHYLAKPADADEVLKALGKSEGDTGIEVKQQPMSPKRLEWEHIQKVLTENGGNISETARQLGLHRRTLQRKLQKRPVNE